MQVGVVGVDEDIHPQLMMNEIILLVEIVTEVEVKDQGQGQGQGQDQGRIQPNRPRNKNDNNRSNITTKSPMRLTPKPFIGIDSRCEQRALLD